MDLGRVIGHGARADVYALGADKAVKLYWAGTPTATADLEFTKARAVYQAGLPVPAVFDRVDIDGRPGIVFERVPGRSLADVLGRGPWRYEQVGRTLAELHASIHQEQLPEIPTIDIRARLAQRITESSGLPSRIVDAVLAVLDKMPDDTAPRLCHGDFHGENVLMSLRGPAVIDWPDSLNADPAVDVARTVLVHRLAPYQARGLKRLATRALIWKVERSYLRRYSQLCSLDLDALEAWQIPLAAARLSEGIRGEDQVVPNLIERLLRKRGVSGRLIY